MHLLLGRPAHDCISTTANAAEFVRRCFENIDDGFALAHSMPCTILVLPPGYLIATIGNHAIDKDLNRRPPKPTIF